MRSCRWPRPTATLSRLHDERLLYITVLTSPTYGGVSASFGWLGDIIIAEPKASIGFAGRRTIEQTGERLPEGFQTAEFMLQHGLIDLIVERKALRQTLSDLLDLHGIERVDTGRQADADAVADGADADVVVLGGTPGGSADGQ